MGRNHCWWVAIIFGGSQSFLVSRHTQPACFSARSFLFGSTCFATVLYLCIARTHKQIAVQAFEAFSICFASKSGLTTNGSIACSHIPWIGNDTTVGYWQFQGQGAETSFSPLKIPTGGSRSVRLKGRHRGAIMPHQREDKATRNFVYFLEMRTQASV